MGIYYVGATSCILERFPRFIQDASKIYGASAGALTAAVLTLGIPLGEILASSIPSRPPFIFYVEKHSIYFDYLIGRYNNSEERGNAAISIIYIYSLCKTAVKS